MQMLQETSQGYDYWRRLSRAHAAMCQAHDAGDTVLTGVRHFVTQRWGGFDQQALHRLADWLVAEHGLTREEAEGITLPELLVKLRTPAAYADDESDMSLRRVGEVWHLRYRSEKADFPVAGNKFLGWLAKLLSNPDRSLTVAELLGDAESRLAADARLGGARMTDEDGLRALRTRVEDIDTISEQTGGSEELDSEKEEILRQLRERPAARRMGASVKKAYDNITTQKRKFLQKLKPAMPQLADHLKGSLVPHANDYTISYRPPRGTPRWQVENPSA